MKPIPSKKQKKKPNKNDTHEQSARKKHKRVPRPIGTTYLCQQYTQSQDPKTKEKIINNYINQYLNHNILIYDRLLKKYRLQTIQELAQFLNIPEQEIVIKMNKRIARIGNLFESDKGNIARAIFFQALNLASETRSLTQQQLAILMASQGNKYVPFVSGEVNKAIANLIASNKPLMELLRLFTGANTTPILVPNATDLDSPNGNQKGYITVDTAMSIIAKNGQSLLTDPSSLDAKLLELGDVPEIRPNFQNGDILRGQSLTQLTDEEAQRLEKTGHHEHRRQANEGIQDIEAEEDWVA